LDKYKGPEYPKKYKNHCLQAVANLGLKARVVQQDKIFKYHIAISYSSRIDANNFF
jgi:hypothetical protein